MCRLPILALAFMIPLAGQAKSLAAQQQVECKSVEGEVAVVFHKGANDAGVLATLTKAGAVIFSEGIIMQDIPMRSHLRYSGARAIETEARVDGYDTPLWDVTVGNGSTPQLNLHTGELFKQVSNVRGIDGADPYVVTLICSGAVENLF